MIRYRAYMHLGGAWHIADTFARWVDALDWMHQCDRHGAVAIVVREGGRPDRSIRETGKLPSETKQQVARLGALMRARRAAARLSPEED